MDGLKLGIKRRKSPIYSAIISRIGIDPAFAMVLMVGFVGLILRVQVLRLNKIPN